MKRATIEDVAKAAGVSRQTVSRAVNNKGEISPATRERVLTVVKELNYQPNRLAQGMVTQRTYMVGIEIPDVKNPFFAEVVRGAQDVAAEHNYNMFLVNTDNEASATIKAISNLVAQGVDGIIAFAANVSDAELCNLAERNIPLVLINRECEHKNVGSVQIDIGAAAFFAVEYLLKNGHEHIGMLTNIFSASRRTVGYKEALKKYGLPLREEYIVAVEPTLEGGYQAAEALIKNNSQISAIFCYNDLMATGAVRACLNAHLRIPEDCAVIGFDDISLAALIYPALTTIRLDKYQIGYSAMAKLIEMIENPNNGSGKIELGFELVVRESA